MGQVELKTVRGGVIRKSAHNEEGLPDFLFLFYFQPNAFRELSGLTGINGLQASKKGQQFMAANDMSQYYVQNEIGVVTVQLVPCLPRIVLVPEEFPLLQCAT